MASASAPPSIAISAHDPSSYANNRAAQVTHSHIVLAVDFAASVLRGHVDHSVKLLSDSAVLILDSRDLTVTGVEAVQGDKTEPLKFSFGAEHETFGRAMQIDLPAASQKAGSTLIVRVSYSTAPSASAIQWLSPEQTKGGKHPYLFTQAQAIHCRSMLPVQDSPSNKFTYSAVLTVDAPLVALMSAEQTSSKAVGQSIEYTFTQKVPIPSYLLAMAVGALEKRRIGPRSHVWSEAGSVDAGAFEFSETEKFIAAGEAICGPYVWGQYDVLLLPPSFPYGGMENPCLTFVTPTLIAGDRSLSNVVAHEIAHSWFGNYVTSETWESFWMNEGFTVFLERKIVQALQGKAHRDLHAQIGLNDLQKSVDRFGADHPYTCLCPRLQNVDPDDAFSSVPYEKGFNFLSFLETLVGGESVMNPFLKAHCERYAHKTVNSTEWKAFFLEYMSTTGKVAPETLAKIDWEAWYNGVGMPPVANVFDQSLIKGSEELAARLIESNAEAKVDDLSGWDSAQKIILLEKFIEYQTARRKGDAKALEAFGAQLLRVDAVYKFSSSQNAELRFRWLTLAIRQPFEEQFPLVEKFLSEQGRMKYTRPLYRDLFNNSSAKGKAFSLEVFGRHRAMYHSICSKMVAKDLEL